jgi:hypothetical protein
VADQVGALHARGVHGGQDVVDQVVWREGDARIGRVPHSPRVQQQQPEAAGEGAQLLEPGPAVAERARDQDDVGAFPDELESGSQLTFNAAASSS